MRKKKSYVKTNPVKAESIQSKNSSARNTHTHHLQQCTPHAELILFNKPFQVISQFSAAGSKTTLAAFINAAGFYPAGRLDYDSEGLLLLTNNSSWQMQISHPDYHLEKTYWVQVEGFIDDAALKKLTTGIQLKDGKTRPAKARCIEQPDFLWPRNPPIRQRKHIPTSWLELQISEGKNRQVRRMTAAVGFPTLRLIRYAVGTWNITGLAPGMHKKIILDTATHH